MKAHLNKLCTLTAGMLLVSSLTPMAHAEFTVSSKDISAGQLMSKKQEFAGFGCTGENMSPELTWTEFPKNTKSFAVTAYDPDAPTGSGWWHWVLINIPADINQLVTGAGSPEKTLLPAGSQMFRNDYGTKTFGGACPPEGDKAHRYQFKVFALSVEKLELPEDASAALVGYYLHSNVIKSATLEALYKR